MRIVIKKRCVVNEIDRAMIPGDLFEKKDIFACANSISRLFIFIS